MSVADAKAAVGMRTGNYGSSLCVAQREKPAVCKGGGALVHLHVKRSAFVLGALSFKRSTFVHNEIGILTEIGCHSLPI